MIEVKEGPGPFVIDRRLPSIFVRAPGVLELVSEEEGTEALRFPSAQAAWDFLHEKLDAEGVAAYRWTILPAKEAGL